MSDQSATKKPDASGAENIIVICSPGKTPPTVIAPLEVSMQKTEGVEFKRTQTIKGATALAQKSKKVVAVLCVGDKSELVSALEFLTVLHPRITNGTVRVLVINRISHPKIPHMLKTKGAGEVLEYNISQKSISFKLNTLLKLVHQSYEKYLKNAGKAPINKGIIAGGGKAAAGKMSLSGAKDSGAEIVWEKPLTFENDIWLINSKKDVRCVLGRWLIHLVGPGPSIGTFEPSPLTFAGEKGWVWTLRKGKETFFGAGEGKWVFFGRQPEFLWQKNIWSFVSNHPTLALYMGEDATYYRMLCEKGTKLLIAENSEIAKQHLPGIKETIEMSVRFKNDLANKKGQDSSPAYADTGAPIGESLSDEEIMGMDTGASDVQSAEEEGWEEGAPLLGGEEANGEELDWSKVGKRSQRSDGVAATEGEEETVTDEDIAGYEMEYSEQVAMSKAGVPWKQGKDAFAEITLEFLVKSKNGAELIKPELVNLLEAQNGEAIMDTAEGQFKVGENLMLLVRLVDAGAANEFDVIAKVERFEGKPDEGRQITVFKLDSENQSMIEEILKLYVQRQSELSEFFQTAKGA